MCEICQIRNTDSVQYVSLVEIANYAFPYEVHNLLQTSQLENELAITPKLIGWESRLNSQILCSKFSFLMDIIEGAGERIESVPCYFKDYDDEPESVP